MRTRRDEATSQQERFSTYLDRMTEAAGHADRIVPMQNYVKGLLLPLERKSVEPMAARLAPGNVRQMHQIGRASRGKRLEFRRVLFRSRSHCSDAELCQGPAVAPRTQECRADGGTAGSGKCAADASVAASHCGGGGLER